MTDGLWKLRCMGVAVRGSCGVCKLLVWELQCAEVNS